MDIKNLQKQLDSQLAKNVGMELLCESDGFSLERLYQVAGNEDRVITVSFKEGSSSYATWGEDITCCLVYTERERLQLQDRVEMGENTYGKVKARYLLPDLSEDFVRRLEREGFDSRDVVEVLVAPNLNPENVYKGKKLRKLNTIEIEMEPEPPLDELKIHLGILEHFLRDGMLLTPAEHEDYTALRLVFGIPLSDEENKRVFDDTGRIHNNEVSRRYLLYKSRLTPLPEDKQKQQAQLESLRISEREGLLNERLKEMGYNLKKLKSANDVVYTNIMQKVVGFNDVRLNAVGKFPVYLDFEGYIHIGLRHISEWQFCDYYSERGKFQLKEKDVVSTLKRVVDIINDDYQAIKESRPDFQYRKYGRQSIYLSGDYYMLHIAANGRIENFSKSVDVKYVNKPSSKV